MSQTPKIIFIFNTTNNLFGKIFNSDPLYSTTHGPFSKKRDWVIQEEKLPYEAQYIFKEQIDDTLRQQLGENPLPTIALVSDNNIQIIVANDEIQACKGSPLALMAAIQKNIQIHE